jgi:dTDP-4-amino-4,6-dideoxygalactose transaminase
LENKGIETRYLFPLLSQPVYRRLFPGLAQQYPVAQRMEKQGFFIGMHQGLEDEDMFFIADIIKEHLNGVH